MKIYLIPTGNTACASYEKLKREYEENQKKSFDISSFFQ